MKDRLIFKNKKIMFRRGASILPSLFTLANMLLGYMAVISAIKGNFEHSVNLCLVAGILDMLDGRIARMTGTSSEFGKELDSLADFLSFGIAPALILYFWGFSELGKFGWLFAFLLPLAGAIRLARFNVQAQIVDKRFFVGLPIPAAAAAALFPLYFLDADFLAKIKSFSHFVFLAIKTSALAYVILIAFMMVSTVKYRSFKDLDISKRKPAPFFFFLMIFIIIIVLYPQGVLLSIAVAYLLSGPFSLFVEKIFRKSPKQIYSQEVVGENEQKED
ncbi:MAG: CDP-diacylglycerol--serine O-phosphatidyltransferase [Acidobacteria bacterium]|nr:CDP-diacylglycerol--serine O-phosphatidyltransferase [Acidobacteriota bacterium]